MSPLRKRRPSVKKHMRGGLGAERAVHTRRTRKGEVVAPVGRDHLAERITFRRGLTGAKPERFCRWVLDLLGYIQGDEVDDLFPGTGIMGRVLAQGVLS